MEWSPVYHVKGWGKFNRHYGDFCTGADIRIERFPERDVSTFFLGQKCAVTRQFDFQTRRWILV
jgi:hypothetical protein